MWVLDVLEPTCALHQVPMVGDLLGSRRALLSPFAAYNMCRDSLANRTSYRCGDSISNLLILSAKAIAGKSKCIREPLQASRLAD